MLIDECPVLYKKNKGHMMWVELKILETNLCIFMLLVIRCDSLFAGILR